MGGRVAAAAASSAARGVEGAARRAGGSRARVPHARGGQVSGSISGAHLRVAVVDDDAVALHRHHRRARGGAEAGAEDAAPVPPSTAAGLASENAVMILDATRRKDRVEG